MSDCELIYGDCIPSMFKRLAPESIHLCVTSIPFESLFMYSGKTQDIGNNPSTTELQKGQFGLNMRFFVNQLMRVLVPGCVAAIHIQQLLRYKNQHGYMGRRDFRGAMIDVFCAEGMQYSGEVVIPKNPQIIAQRLSLHSLQFQTGIEGDARRLMPAVNDFILIFSKPGDTARPVHCLYDSERNPNGWVTTDQWINWASGTWTDIIETDVLEGAMNRSDKPDDEKHVCPLQCSVPFRAISLWTNPGETVLDPFMGIGTTAWVARGGKSHDGKLKDPRRVVGFELKESYQKKSLKYMEVLARCQADEARTLFTETEKR